jgi:PST family polysaccharide transporter
VTSTLKEMLYRLLRRSEHYTKTDMVYLASGGFWLILGQTVSSFFAFGLAIAFANLVPPDIYGTYKYLLSILGILNLCTLPEMNTAVARSVARGDSSTIHAATRARIAWSFAGTVTAFMGGAYYAIHGNMEVAIALAIIGVALPLFDTFTLYNAYLTGTRNFKKKTLFQLTSQGISVLSLILTLFVTNNVLLLLLAYFIPLSLVHILLYTQTMNAFMPDARSRETLTYGKQLSLIGVLAVVAGNIDKVLLWKFLGPAQLAIYTFAIAVPEQLKGPLKGVGELSFPKFAAQTREHIKENLHALWRKLALYALGLLGISLIYILTAPFIFQLFFPRYMESVIYSQLFSLSLLISFGPIFSALLAAQKATKAQLQINIFQSTLQILLYILLIPHYGIAGALTGFMATRIAATLYTFLKIRTVLKK